MTYRISSFTPLAVLLAVSLVPLGCSDDDPEGDTHAEHDHDHTTPIEIEGEDVPTISLTAHEDGAGHNLEIVVENFEFAPQNASTEHVEGEGHAHVYVDGEKLGRIYSPWYYLGGLEEGEHEVRVELSANSHNPLAKDGEIIDATVTIDVPTPSEGHAHEHLMVDWEPVPSLSIEVHDDPSSGWNVEATLSDFILAPENVSTDHVEGEGHMHLYVNDTKLTRMYGSWYHIPEMPLGTNTVRVELSSNDHRPLMHGGELIDDSVEVDVTESDPHSHGHSVEGGAGGAHH